LKPYAPAATRADSGEHDFLLPYAKQLYRTDEVAECIGRDPAYVRTLIDAGRLEAHRDSSIEGGRLSNRVTRRSLLLYLVETANYCGDETVARVEAVLKTLRPHHVRRLKPACEQALLPHVNLAGPHNHK
jgi:hypothetical protein